MFRHPYCSSSFKRVLDLTLSTKVRDSLITTFRDMYVHVIVRSSHWRCSVKKMFFKISQNSQENTRTRVSFLIRLQVLGLRLYLKRDYGGLKLYLKKRLWHRYFPVNVAKFLRTPFLQNTSGRLLLIKLLTHFTPLASFYTRGSN